MTRKAIIEAIQYRLKPIDKSQQFNLGYIEGWCNTVWEQKIAEYISQGNIDYNFFRKKYIVDGDNILVDSTSGRYYINLPAQPLSIPIEIGGAVRIYENESVEYDFKVLTERDFRLIQKQDVNKVNCIDDIIYFYYTKDRIWFRDDIPQDLLTDGVSLDLSIAFEDYDITESLPMPISNDYSTIFINTVVSVLSGTPMVDLNNNKREWTQMQQ